MGGTNRCQSNQLNLTDDRPGLPGRSSCFFSFPNIANAIWYSADAIRGGLCVETRQGEGPRGHPRQHDAAIFSKTTYRKRRMIAALASFVLAVTIAAAATPLVTRFALRRRLFDAVTSNRKIHSRPIPRLGGIAIIFAFYTALVCPIAWFMQTGASPRSDRPGSLWVLAGGFVIALLGVYDDVRGADAKTKLAVQFAVATALYATGFRIDHIATPLGSFSLGPLSFPFTLLWIVGVTNAVNLIDGLDGLAGGVAFIALGAIFTISAIRHETFMMLVTGTLSGSVLGFLVYNFNPASIFMGDSGSMFLGFMVATSSIRASQKTSTAVAIVIPILVLAIPIADTLLALVRRAFRRQGLFTGDREHIHHQLLDSGLSHRTAVVALYALSAAYGLSAITLFVREDRVTVLILCGALILASGLLVSRLWRYRHVCSTSFRTEFSSDPAVDTVAPSTPRRTQSSTHPMAGSTLSSKRESVPQAASYRRRF